MVKEDLVLNNLVVPEATTIREVMVAITDNQRGAVVVVDDNFVLQGVVSDGDLRRALVRGATEFTPISKCVNTRIYYVSSNNVKDAQSIFDENQEVTLLPVVDGKNKVVNVLVRNARMQ